MIDISKNSNMKYLLFGTLYFSEGIELTLATLIVSFYLSDKGLPVPVITAVAAAALIPWSLKFIWGGIADYFQKFGRKPFIVFGGLLGGLSLFVLILIDPSVSLIPFAFFLVLSHVGVSFLDVSADALAIQISKEEERGKISGAMYAGLFFGSASSAIFLGFIADNFGYNATFIVTGIIILLIIIFPVFVKDIKITKKRHNIGKTLLKEFKKRNIQIMSILAPISSISAGIMFFVTPLYIKDVLNLNLVQSGILVAMFPTMMGIGSVIGGIISDKFGRKIALYLFFGFSTVVFATLALGTEWLIFTIVYGMVGFLVGGFHAATCAYIMDITNPKIAATEYSVITSLFNVGEWAGGSFGGSLVAVVGYARSFLYSGWFFGPALLIIYFLKIKSNKIKENKCE
jgi:PAT family beta-lactamase induction signal transducer AmpG